MTTSQSLLDYAMKYHKRGWNVIPIIPARKTPPRGFEWIQYQTERVTEDQLREWFGNDKHDMAAITGPISEGLTVVDFDSEEGYQWWKDRNSNLAKELPTVKTGRGYHVYCRSSMTIKKSYTKIDLIANGLIKLPPSMHKTNTQYKWFVPLPEGSLPEHNPLDWHLEDFSEIAHVTERAERTERTQGDKGVGVNGNSNAPADNDADGQVPLNSKIESAIEETLPKQHGTRHRKIFDFARHLRSMPEYADAEPERFKYVVVEWHRRALPNITTREFTETWIDFLKAWPKIKHTLGEGPLEKAFQRAAEGNRPQIALKKYPDDDKLQILVALCRELQKEAGSSPFFLSCRSVGKLFAVCPMTGSRWLWLLRSDHIIEEAKTGGTTEGSGKATRYRYTGLSIENPTKGGESC